MDATFLCRVKLPNDDPSTLAGIAEQITESLEMDGLEVQSVVPWERDGLSSFPEPTAPITLPASLA